jgi:hypothetical protein
LGFGFGALAVSLGFLDRCLGVDFGNVAVLLADSLGFSYISFALGIGDIDTCLVDGPLVCFSGQRLEVVGVGGVAEFFDVGVINLETELAEFALDVLVDLLLELLTLSEDCRFESAVV